MSNKQVDEDHLREMKVHQTSKSLLLMGHVIVIYVLINLINLDIIDAGIDLIIGPISIFYYFVIAAFTILLVTVFTLRHKWINLESWKFDDVKKQEGFFMTSIQLLKFVITVNGIFGLYAIIALIQAIIISPIGIIIENLITWLFLLFTGLNIYYSTKLIKKYQKLD